METKQLLLKPCPFCGSKDIEVVNTWTLAYWAQCQACWAQVDDPQGEGRDGTPEEHLESYTRAAQAWNSRHE